MGVWGDGPIHRGDQPSLAVTAWLILNEICGSILARAENDDYS